MSKAQQKLPPKAEIDEAMQFLFSDAFRDNPLLFVTWAFPWGVKGFPLADQKGPRKWQREELLKIAEFIKENKARVSRGEKPLVYKLAIASGRGIGKSTFVSWICLWMMCCHYGSTSIVSANTDDQISNKTFGEIGRWRTLMLNNHFFVEQTQKNISPAPWLEKLLKDEMAIDTTYYYCRGVLWDGDKPDSFAGAHSSYAMLVVFDEASGIDSSIWDVTRGFFTDNIIYRFWLVFSNPRSGSGAFYDCFFDEKGGWVTRNINSLDVPELDHSELLGIIHQNGADSDKAKVEVYGQFPRHGDRQFISRAIVEEAATRSIPNYNSKRETLLLGVDVARFGDDSTVLAFRAGRDARSIPPIILTGLDNMAVVQKVLQAIHDFNPEHIFIDAGAGAGVIDRLRELKIKVHEVNFGGGSGRPEYFDHRTEMYGELRDWLPGGMIMNDRQLKSDLMSPEKEIIGRESKEKLESKEKMKKRGIKSPDWGDALALTFHMKIPGKDSHTSRKSKPNKYKSWTKPLLS